MAPKGRSFQISATPVTVLAHLTVIAVITLVLVWLLHFRAGLAFQSVHKDKIINMHAFLMVVGFVAFSGEAIMAYKTIPARRNYRKVAHLILHLIALVAGTLGLYLAFKFHHDLHLPDLVSLHSWFGIITVSLFALQWLFGFFAYFFPGAETWRRAQLMPWHVFFGVLIFLLAACTSELGLLERFNVLGLGRSREGLIVNFTGLLIVLFAACVCLSVILPPVY